MTKAVALAFIALFIAMITIAPTSSARKSYILGASDKVAHDPTEWTFESILASHVYYASLNAGYTSLNYYWEQTTYNNILSAAGSDKPNSIVFYIGEGVTDGYHYKIETYEGYYVQDNTIYGYTVSQNLKFVYLWSCYQGNEIGGGSGYYAHGMPYAWLHTNQLSHDGYHNPDGDYVFIGFHGPAPFLTEQDPQFTSGSSAVYPLYSFNIEFYSKALGYYCYAGNIKQSLDYASYLVWGKQHFDKTVLWQGYWLEDENGKLVFGRMKVYGNGYLNIS